MKKIFTKLIGVTLGLAMAVGVGVGVASNNRKATGLNAADSIYQEADLSAKTASNSSYGAEWTYGDYKIFGGANNNGGWAYVSFGAKKGSNDESKTTNAYVKTTSTIGSEITKVTFTVSTARKSGGTVTASLDVCSNNNFSTNNVNVNYGTVNQNTATTHTIVPSSGNSWSTGMYYRLNLTCVNTTTQNGMISLTNIAFWQGDGTPVATVSSVSISGSMSKTEYTTVDSWSNAGLTANVTMSDSSPYTGDVSWSYSPNLTPAAAVIANDNNEVAGYSLTATATAGGQSASKTATGVSVSYATVPEALDAIPNANDTVEHAIVEGIVSRVTSVDTTSFYNATYYISEDGSENDELQVYRGKGLNNAGITNVNDIQVGDTVLVYGDIKYYNGNTKEFLSGNYLLDLDRPASSEPSITITTVGFTMDINDADVLVEADAENIPDGGSVVWESSPTSVATIVNDGGDYKVHAVASGSATITAKILNSSSVAVASNSITVTIVEQDLQDDDSFIIKAVFNESTYYMSGVGSKLGTVSSNKNDAMVFTAIEGETPNQFQLKNNSNYLSYSGSNNEVYLTTDSESDTTFWTVLKSGDISFIESVKVSGRKLQYNNNGDPGDNSKNRFACYASAQTAVSIEKIEAPKVNSVTVAGDSTANANNALSIVKEFMYEVTYVNPLVPGTGAVNVTIKNSSDGTDGAELTTAPNAGTFSVTFTISDTYTVTVASAENPAKSDSTTIVVSNIYVPPVPVSRDYDLYNNSSTIAEGDYIIYSDEVAMNNTISSDRAQYEDATPENNKISTSDASLIWHIAPAEEGYYTIYNAEAGKYLASTGANNKVQLLTNGSDDKSLWSYSESEFVNKYNSANDKNASLHKNGTYGFACYADNFGSSVSLYRLNDVNGYLARAVPFSSLTDNILRLGSSIPVEAWNSIAATATIDDYGVMVYKTDDEANIQSETPVEDAYRNPNVTRPAIANRGSGQAPAATDGNYVFTVRMSVANQDTIFCSASFIRVGETYYFFNEQHVTARQLASN